MPALRSPLVLLALLTLPLLQLHAQSGELTLNKNFSCKEDSGAFSLVRKDTELTENESSTLVKRLGKKLKRLKKKLRSVKQSGTSGQVKKAKKRVKKTRTLRKSLRDCLDGELEVAPPTQEPPTINFPLAARVGTYSGTWNNLTFMTTGPILLSLGLENSINFSLTLDLGGNVFGGEDPPAVLFEGTFSGSAPFVFTYESAVFGSGTTVTVDAEGNIQLVAPNPATGLTNFTLNLTFDDTAKTASGTYTVSLGDTPVNGTASLGKN